MYIDRTRSYCTASGEQRVAKGRFLILLQPTQATISETCCAENTYAIVRSVALRQCGHWMMGVARVEGKSISMSGAYGNDGVPCDIDKLPKDAVKLPLELYEAWANGGGWNSAGSEAEAMAAWARSTFK